MIYITAIPSPLGIITLASDGENLKGLWIEGQKYFRNSIRKETCQKDDLKVFHLAEEWLSAYFKGNNPSLKHIPLKPDGSEFQKQVWEILCDIPYGQVITYGDIARKIAVKKGVERMSAQAVGGAVGHNPVSIIIPCHRVIGSDGSLTGYAGGIDKKIFLLRLEGADMSNLYVPKKGTAI